VPHFHRWFQDFIFSPGVSWGYDHGKFASFDFGGFEMRPASLAGFEVH